MDVAKYDVASTEAEHAKLLGGTGDASSERPQNSYISTI